LKGRVCAPNEQVFLNGAVVSIDAVDCDGSAVHLEVTSGLDGSYEFPEVPCGTWTVEIVKGSFTVSYGVPIEAGVDHDVTGAAEKLCFLATSATIAVMEGSWDDIGSLLSKLGLAYDTYTVEDEGKAGTILGLLSDPGKLSQYDILVANCGAYHGWMPIDFPEVMPNVRDFVLAGGSLYTSDYAWVYGEWAFPEAIEFFKSDDVLDMYTDESPQMLQTGLTIEATVVDGTLASWLGKVEIPIVVDSGPQIAPQAVGPGSFGHAVGHVFQPFGGDDAIDATIPLAISYVPAAGAGRVIYTNFHNDAQATADMLAILDYLVFTL
jgi:hypothetical protein